MARGQLGPVDALEEGLSLSPSLPQPSTVQTATTTQHNSTQHSATQHNTTQLYREWLEGRLDLARGQLGPVDALKERLCLDVLEAVLAAA
jgi:hypothetical protein